MAKVFHHPGRDIDKTIESFNKQVKKERIIEKYRRSSRFKSKSEVKRLKSNRLKKKQKKTRSQNGL